jgi:hypothetical protein
MMAVIMAAKKRPPQILKGLLAIKFLALNVTASCLALLLK